MGCHPSHWRTPSCEKDCYVYHPENCVIFLEAWLNHHLIYLKCQHEQNMNLTAATSLFEHISVVRDLNVWQNSDAAVFSAMRGAGWRVGCPTCSAKRWISQNGEWGEGWSNIGFLGAIFWDKAIFCVFFPGTRNISQKKCILPTSLWTTAFNHTVGGSCRRKKSMFSTHAPDVLSGRDAEIVVANMALPTTFGAATRAKMKTPYSSVTMVVSISMVYVAESFTNALGMYHHVYIRQTE